MELKIYKLHVLKIKLASIAGRALISFLLAMFMGGSLTLGGFLIYYLIVSWCWIFVDIFKNWLIGIVAAVIALFLLAEKATQSTNFSYVLFIGLVGIFVIDIINIICFIAVNISITREKGE